MYQERHPKGQVQQLVLFISERYSIQCVSVEPAVDRYLINSVAQLLLIPIM
jgi:hypothetical protein